jgi:hypothetical protein
MRASLSVERIRKRPRNRHSPSSNRLPASRDTAAGAVRGGEKRRAADASRAQTPRSRASRFRAAGDLRRLRSLLKRANPPTFADGLAIDCVLQPPKQRLKLVDPLLQRFDAPLMSRSSRLGRRVRGPPSATQLNDTAENRHATHRPPA